MRQPTLTALAVLAVIGCRSAARDEEVSVRVPVTTALIIRDSMPEELAVIGILRPAPGHQALLSAPTAALVRETRVQLGQRVAAGTVLIQLDAPELTAAAQSGQTAADLARLDADRQRALLDQGITARRTVEEKDAVARSADASAASALAQLSRTTIRSPIAGEVQRIVVQPGERVEAGAVLAEVVDRAVLDLSGAVPAASMARLHPGQTAVIVAEGFPAPVTGRVLTVPPALDSASHSGQVVIRMMNPGTWPAGLGATGLIRIGMLRNALIVPDSALVMLGDSQFVFVVGPDSVAHARGVTVLGRQRGRLAVTGQLEASDRVVTTGSWGLADGMAVTPQMAPK
ncbi:MAG: efflux RND transporter periplasmic adaptor subunit [Gemmatimonadota bacterium]